MKRFLVVIALIALGGGILLTYRIASKKNHETGHVSASPPSKPASPRDSTCPIKRVHPGMALQDVRAKLGEYLMDYRGTRQDEDAYFVDAGTCHAFLDFNSQDGGLDSIDYRLGFDKIEFRRKAAPLQTTSPVNGTDANSDTTKGRPSPPPSNTGYPVSEQTFVNAYVLANIGKDDLDKDQLEQLAHDEYRMGKDIDTQSLLLADALISTRAKRAMEYLESIRQLQRTQ